MYDESGELLPDDPWSSVVDLMSALVLVLFLAVIFFVSSYSESTEELEAQRVTLGATREALDAKRVELERTLSDLSDTNAALRLLEEERARLREERAALLGDKEELSSERDALSSERVGLLSDKERLTSERAALEEERRSLLADKESLERDRARLSANNSSLGAQNSTLADRVASLQRLLQEQLESRESVMASFEESVNRLNAEGVSVDKEGGKLILKSEVLFEHNQASLSPRGLEELRAVSQALGRVLRDPKLKNAIEGVMIEGHTSSEGSVTHNLKLSSERALSALTYLLSLPEGRGASPYKRLLFAGAFGEGRPALDAQGRESSALSRRIEIRVLFHQPDTRRIADDIADL